MYVLFELAAVYALLGLGFVLFFGVARTANFAWCDTIVLAILLLTNLHANFSRFLSYPAAGVLSFLVVVLVLAVVNASIFFICFRPFRSALSLWPAVASLSVGLIIREGIAAFTATGTQQIKTPGLLKVAFGPVFSFGVFFLVLAVILITELVLLRTRFGLRVRAVSEDPDAAEVLGISANNIWLKTFLCMSIVGAFAGLVLEAKLGFIKFNFGPILTVQGFVAACLGGLQRPRYAFSGGIAVALIEWVLRRHILGGGAFYYTILFLCLVVWYSKGRIPAQSPRKLSWERW